MKAFGRFLARWWPSLIVLAVVLYATLWPDPLPDDSGLELFPHADKLIHAIMMGGLTAAPIFDWRRSGHRITSRVVLTVGAAVALFCPLDEWLQRAMGLGRAFEALDLLADWLGIAVAMMAAPPAIRAVLRRVPLK